MKLASILLIGACAAFAQPVKPLMSFTAELDNGIVVHFTTMLEPPFKNGRARVDGGVHDGHDRVYRELIDRTSNSYFGYDLVPKPAGSPGVYQVSIEPLTNRMMQSDAGGLTPAPLPKYPPPQIVREGDTIALDLLVSPDGKQKLVDYIQVGAKVEPPPAAAAAARDFTLDDGPLAISFASPISVFINGQRFQGRVGTTIMRSGSTLWFAPPAGGRYILSLIPHDGFQKAGAIRDHVLSFEDGSDRYEFRASAPILGVRGAWNLYMFHDWSYQSKNPAGVSIGTGRLADLVK